MEITGKSIVGYQHVDGRGEPAYAMNPATGEKLLPGFVPVTAAEADRAAQLAHQAFAVYGRWSGRDKAAFLRRIAANIEALADQLTARAVQETGLPSGRIQSETARTCNQLRLFADLAEEGSWVDARIDHADPDRQPLPKPDVRSLLRPIGPVVVFCASNFPLAFSVAGGDTASALAAGCPVIVKAHHAHPGTAELAGTALRDAARDCDAPEGVFSLLHGPGSEVGMSLIKHPLIKAGGFTGSRAGGRALFDAASSRPEPIPFYAEMSSVNPVFILPRAMRERRDEIAAGLHASVILGAGQFCTKPGMIFMERGDNARAFAKKLAELMTGTPEFTLLTKGIRESYCAAVAARMSSSAVEHVVQPVERSSTGWHVGPAVFQTNAGSFLSKPDLSEEIFGPQTLLITHESRDELLGVASAMEAHLTATVHGTPEDLLEAGDLLRILETKVGRLVFNGFPTGVEVCHAMVHGGPYPATSDGKSTSVGTRAIFRFTRQVCFQNFPEAALPDELKDSNPLGISRMTDGKLRR